MRGEEREDESMQGEEIRVRNSNEDERKMAGRNTAEVRDVGVFPLSEEEVTRTDEEYKKMEAKQ